MRLNHGYQGNQGMQHEDLTRRIIAVAIKVHSTLGVALRSDGSALRELHAAQSQRSWFRRSCPRNEQTPGIPLGPREVCG